jgi:pyrroloquinoline quinone biosynthesis protein D
LSAAILRLCDGSRTVLDIVKELETRYGRPNLQAEVIVFLRQVAERGWIE